MIEITYDTLRQLTQPSEQSTGCVSIYMPTHRKHPENQQDPIRFKNLAKAALEQIGKSDAFTAEAVETVEQELARLQQDPDFWNHSAGGIAWFFHNGQCHVFDLPQAVEEQVVVARSAHVKPLIRVTQGADRYRVLALTRHTAKLYAGNRDAMDEIQLEEVPATIQEALGEETTEPHLGVGSYGGTDAGMFHGHGAKVEETDKDRDRYFREVATAVEKHWSQPSQTPLILVALAEHHSHYQRIAKDRLLLPDAVPQDPASLSAESLHAATWEVMKQHFDAQLEKFTERLGDTVAQGKGSSIVSDVVREAANGRVELLLLEADAKLPGRVDWTAGAIQDAPLNDPDVDDALDDLAEMVIAQGGTVRIVESGALQAASKMGAIYRY